MKTKDFLALARKMGGEVRPESGGEGTVFFPSPYIRDEFLRLVSEIDASGGKLKPACLPPFDDLQP